jgi:hypothetical protein
MNVENNNVEGLYIVFLVFILSVLINSTLKIVDASCVNYALMWFCCLSSFS